MIERALSLDTETHPFAPGRQAPKLVVMSTFDGESALLHKPKQADELVEDALRDPAVMLVGQYIAFDLSVFCQRKPELFELVFAAYEQCRIWDVGVYERLRKIALGRFDFDGVLRSRPTFSLAELVFEYLGRDRTAEKKGPDKWRTRYNELEDLPFSEWPAAAVDYSLDDARDPFEIWKRQVDEASSGGGIPTLFHDACAQDFAFRLSASWGIRTDGAAVAELERRLRKHVDEAEVELIAAGVMRANGSKDTKAIGRLVELAYGDEVERTPAGKPRQATEYLAESGDAVLELIAESAADRDELSRYVPLLKLGAQWPINPRVNITVATFRMSYSKPNLQNQPRRSGVRECFVPRPGFVFVASDFHIAELCSLAQTLYDLFGYSAMRDEIVAGRDLHLAFGAELGGLDYDEAVARLAAGDKRTKELRQMAKAANFGYPGGLGARRFVQYAKGYGVELDLDESTRIRDRWLSRFPEMRRYFDHIGDLVGGGSFSHTHPRTGFVRGNVGYCDGCNQSFQHLTAVGARAAFLRAVRESYVDRSSALFGSRPVVFIHDEIIAETPRAGAHEAAKRLEVVMVEEMSRYTPDVPARATAHLMERWYKDAEPVFDEAGRLVPWRP